MKKTFIKKGVFTCIATIFGIVSSLAQTITTGLVTPTTVCAGSDISVAFTTTGTFASGTVFTVQLSNAAGTFGSPATLGTGTATPINVTIPSATAAGAAYKVRVISVTPAVTGSASAALKVNAVPGPPTGTDDVVYTKGAVAEVLDATGTNLKWYKDATGGTELETVPTPQTTTVGTTSYYVTQTIATCESERAKIDVIVNCPTVAAPTATNKTYTVGDDADPLTATPTTGLHWYKQATGGTGETTAPTPETTAAGTTSYWVSRIVDGCESARTKIDVVVSCAPPAKPTVTNKTYTVGETATVLTATGVTGATFKWYETLGGTTPLASAPTPSTTAVGSRSYFVTQTVGGCESAKTELIVTVNACVAPAKPTVVSPVNYFVGDAAIALKATASSGGTLNWYGTNETGGTRSGTAPTPSTTSDGETSYYVSQTIGVCESPRAKIDVVVTCKVIPKPTVGVIAAVCLDANVPATVLSNAVTPKTGLLWYKNETGGVGSATVPTPDTETAGTKTYYVSQTVSGCESARQAVSIVVKATAAPVVTAPDPYCQNVKATALTATGTALKWYTVATGGASFATAPTPQTTTAGTTSYYVSQTVTGCESPRAKIDVVVNPIPAAVTLTNEVLCQERENENYSFPVKATTGNTLNWYTAATGGTPSKTAPSINLKTAATSTFYVTQVTAKGCESSERVSQKIRVKPLPALPGVDKPLIEYCQFLPAQPLTATPLATATLNWYGTDATGGTSSAVAPVPSTETGGTTSFYVAQTLEGCIGDRAKIDVKINTTPKPATTTYLAYCQNEVAPVLDATGTILKWYREANGVDWQGVPFTPFTEKVQDYSFYVTQTGTNGCESPKEEIKIHIKSLPSATISGNSNIDLGQTATISLKFTGDGPWGYVLSNGITDTTEQETQPVQVKPAVTTTYRVTEVSNACGKGLPIGSAVVTVKVPTISSGNPSVAEVCAGKTFTLPFQQSGDFPPGNTFKVQISPENVDGKFYTINSVATANQVTATFPDTTTGGSYFVRVISSGTDPDYTIKGSVSAITITASPLPIGTITGAQTILVGESATLKVEFIGKSPWTFTLANGTKDSLITAAISPYSFEISPQTTTIYTVKQAENGCGIGKGAGSARVQVDPILGIEPSTPSNWVKVYPTLIEETQCTIELNIPVSPKEATIELIDMNGRSRSVKQIRQKTTQFNLSGYPSGLYLIKVKNGNLSAVQRILKP
ncbi:Ig-like domain-containing protein [Dyadobacter bucti]|uniref:Ig-like domain-containing protein n=1 Tax=Dyadobacter bucti TaxID=2572203 RepID=UPI001108F480|nr:T9SS type A sorting domain-containing protein [Dyadobacter bucti]